MNFTRSLTRVIEDLALDIDGRQFDALVSHYRLLECWNAKINLTAVRDPEEAALRHYGESLFLHMHLPSATDIADIGSGAGFPGFPLAVLRPETNVYLVEAVRKKAMFLEEASREMANISVVPVPLFEWKGSSEWATMRAVAPKKVLGELASRVKSVAILGTDHPPDTTVSWQKPIELPWGQRRRLWMGFT